MADKHKVNGSESQRRSSSTVETVAAVAVIGIGAALIEVEWIPGILIGIGAMLAPKLIPGLTGAMKPVVRTAIRTVMKTGELVAEAKEQIEDIVAEVRAEQEMSSSAGHKETSRPPVPN